MLIFTSRLVRYKRRIKQCLGWIRNEVGLGPKIAATGKNQPTWAAPCTNRGRRGHTPHTSRTAQVETREAARPSGDAMDREWGSKPGSGGAASAQNEAIDRRERLRRLALETIDLAKDPYFMRNHLGRYCLPPAKTLAFFFLDSVCSLALIPLDFVSSYECKLCLTLHNNEGNYLAHTQGKRHQTNLAKRAAREAKDAPAQPQPNKRKFAPRKSGE